jgi:hypothetical protein
VAERGGGGSSECLSAAEGKDVGKPEQGSPAGSERLGRKYSMARCLEWGRGGRRGTKVGCPWWLSDGKHSGVVAVKREEEEEKGVLLL